MAIPQSSTGPLQPPVTSNNDQAEITRLTIENLRKANILLDKQTSEFEEKETKAREQVEIKRKARLAGAQAQEIQRKNQEREQSLCSHQKPNGTTQYVIQGLPAGKQAAMCQACRKMLLGDEVATLPMQLRPNPNHIGGVHY